ncbi:polymer-forming cytoskeletal protein [Citrobacter koseri]|uniref:polymer-forming cytoskeletal protein n=1 Tax=Citrobacter koseri TaxID=545 RepID=UPI002AA2AC5E|nr:polymer-forming cytoskeletal protein [Citrobacter koseri]
MACRRGPPIIVSGSVSGACHAESVVLMAVGRVDGDIVTDELAIENSGVFSGRARRTDEAQEAMPAGKPGKTPSGRKSTVPPRITARDGK